MKQIKVIQIGCGRMSKYIMKYIYDNKHKVVAAVDIDAEKIGKDIGTIINCENKGITIYDISRLNELLKETTPNIAIITTESYLNDIEEIIRICVRNKVNVITTSEETFYPVNSNPTLYHELDILAKSNNVTITGSGYQDVFWGYMVSNLAGSIHNITKIKGSSSYNIEDYGYALAKAHGAGLTLEEFNRNIKSIDDISDEKRSELINNRKYKPSYMWNTVGWLAEKLNLTPLSMKSKSLPITLDQDIESVTLNMNIKAGTVIGMSAVAILETKEGITIEGESIGKIYNENDFDYNEWTIEGEPTTTFKVENPDTVKLTCANIVNRITDVINAKPGFIPTCSLEEPKIVK